MKIKINGRNNQVAIMKNNVLSNSFRYLFTRDTVTPTKKRIRAGIVSWMDIKVGMYIAGKLFGESVSPKNKTLPPHEKVETPSKLLNIPIIGFPHKPGQDK
jgi:hypothetical protein